MINQYELTSCLAHFKHAIQHHWTRGFIAELYAPLADDAIQPSERVFYTHRNAKYLDTAR
ncbi:hypothetical protein [Thiospirillum jenense]|uniref:hypothetical protein n=1 Tax=Thiospirillum jenense TaxID=1653858 RepID=UPI00193271F3|nr:hypothetical protein [Thiospirillum jenense]